MANQEIVEFERARVMSHILFVTYYYPPEKGAAMVRIGETAKRLVKLGHQVTVLTTVPNYPTGVVPTEYRGHIIQKEILDGVRVVRVWNYINSNTSFLRRIVPHISFAFLAPIIGGKAVGHPDIIIVQSPPLFDAIPGRMLAWIKRCSFIFWVSDLWPETPVQLGVLRNPIVIWLSERLEWSTYQRARLVWVVTKGVCDRLIERGLSPEKIFLLINGVDTNKFFPMPQTQARAELGWDDRFTVLYAGTHGVVHGLATVLDAAELLQHRTDIRFVFVGEGAEKADLISQAQQRNLKNVAFFDSLPNDQIPSLLSAADICLAPMRKARVFKGLLPAKMFEIVSCGRPLILGVDGEARKLVEQEAGAALYVEPENPVALVSAILYLHDHVEVAEKLGQRGRAFAKAHFDRDQLIGVLDERIEILLNKKIKDSKSAMLVPIDSSTSMRVK